MFCAVACFVSPSSQEGVDKVISSQVQGQQNFDVVLMDVNMPKLNGIAAVKIIRSKEVTGELKVRQRIVGLTGNAHSDQIQAALSAGMDDVVVKVCHLFFLLLE